MTDQANPNDRDLDERKRRLLVQAMPGLLPSCRSSDSHSQVLAIRAERLARPRASIASVIRASDPSFKRSGRLSSGPMARYHRAINHRCS